MHRLLLNASVGIGWRLAVGGAPENTRATRTPPFEFIRYNRHLKDCEGGFRLDIHARGQSISHMPARNILTMLAGVIFWITHGRSVNLLHVASATEMLRCGLPLLKPL
jgi:hypothetical protein